MCKVRWLHPAGPHAARSRVFLAVMLTTESPRGQRFEGGELAGDPGKDMPTAHIARQNGAVQSQEAAMAKRERPMNWEDWKWLHRWPRLTSIEWALEWLVYWCKSLAIFDILEFVGRASVLVAVILWFWEADDRQKQKHYRAWELINSARGSPGDGGRRDALQDLNEDKVNLAAAPLTNAYLREVQLPNARLYRANLSEANLAEANLHEADLTLAKLTLSKLTLVKLNGANLSEANLYGADLRGADLRGANLTKADLNRADLTKANLIKTSLRDVSLENAIFCNTIMPDGTVNNRDCPPEPAPPNPSETPPAPN
jgi:hypothetical protein